MIDQYAVHSPQGVSGIRIIGLKTGNITGLLHCFKSKSGRKVDKGLYYGTFNGNDGRLIDEVLLAWDPESSSAELTFHGGEAVAAEITDVLEQQGFIHSEHLPFFEMPVWKNQLFKAFRFAVTRTGLEHFLSYLSGGFEKALLRVVSQIENTRNEEARSTIHNLMNGWEIRNGFIDPPTVYIIGPANAGKSTLFNRIAGYERVVVTDIPGTTTDYVEETVAVRGYPFTFVDTEGLHWQDNPEKVLSEFGERADYIIYVDDINHSKSVDAQSVFGDRLICRLLNKSDTAVPEGGSLDRSGCLTVSALENKGIQEVLTAVYKHAVGISPDKIKWGFYSQGHVKTAEETLKAMNNSQKEKALHVFREGFLAV